MAAQCRMFLHQERKSAKKVRGRWSSGMAEEVAHVCSCARVCVCVRACTRYVERTTTHIPSAKVKALVGMRPYQQPL